MNTRPKKVILVVSEDWYFLSHRFELARHLRSRGWEVVVATQVNRSEDAARIRAAGLRLVPLPLERGRLASPGDIAYVARLAALYWRERPDVVHHVAMKPVLYGSLAALAVRGPGVVNALAGLGYLFTSRTGPAGAVRAVVMRVYQWIFRRRRVRVILQNREDVALFAGQYRVPPANLRLVRGMGVDVGRHPTAAHGPRERPVAVMVARMLRDKGVLELVEAARILKRSGVAVAIRLVGDVDPKNPNSLSIPELRAFEAEGVVEWLGHRTDVPALNAAADIAVLPSYREGMPKSLIEAAAAGLPIVATDTSGCREVVEDGVNGLLVPVRDAERLAEAMGRLVRDPALRATMGAASRRRAEEEFRQERVFEETEAVYAEVCDD